MQLFGRVTAGIILYFLSIDELLGLGIPEVEPAIIPTSSAISSAWNELLFLLNDLRLKFSNLSPTPPKFKLKAFDISLYPSEPIDVLYYWSSLLSFGETDPLPILMLF